MVDILKRVGRSDTSKHQMQKTQKYPPRRTPFTSGIPEDVFLHDLTEHVDYRGLEYDLAGEICDLAAGGQILIGPKTYQR